MVIDDVLDVCFSFLVVNFSFCFYENEVVYRLVKWAGVIVCNEVWVDCIFFWLEDIVVVDILFILN